MDLNDRLMYFCVRQ